MSKFLNLLVLVFLSFILGSIFLLISSCGQSGPLYLPKQDAASSQKVLNNPELNHGP